MVTRLAPVTRLACATLGALLLAVVSTAAPAPAAGKPYSAGTWAGTYAWRVKGPNGPADTWRTPTSVQASWFVPCLPRTFTGVAGSVEGAYDQWIGLEAQDGVNLIQVGVRSYHLNLAFGQFTGYFAWKMSTATGDAYPTQVFPINGCGTAVGRITARVEASGEVCITLESQSRGDCRDARLITDRLPPMPNPRNAAFVIERFAGGTGKMPYFGTAAFDDCRVSHSNDNPGWLIGNQQYVGYYPFDMVNTWWTNKVHTYPPNGYGSFTLVQPPISYYPW